MSALVLRQKAQTCNAQAKRERNPDLRAMLLRNARTYYQMARVAVETIS